MIGGSSALDRDIGKGTPIEILIQWTVAAVSGGASTVTVDLETDDNSAFSSATVLATAGAIAKAVLVAGYQMKIHYMPRGAERYIRLNYTVATADLTAGKVTAGFVAGVQTNDV